MNKKLNNIKDKKFDDPTDFKWYMNSAHDNTILVLYSSLDL